MIFEDPTRKRWRIAVASFTSLAMLGLVLLSLSAAAIMTSPELPGLAATKQQAQATVRPLSSTDSTDTVSQPRTTQQWQHVGIVHDQALLASVTASAASLTSLVKKGSSLRTAFLLQQDTNSLRSFNAHVNELDAVFPDWYFMSRTDCSLDERIKAPVLDSLQKSGVPIIARLTDGEGQTVYKDQASGVMGNQALRQCVASKLASQTEKNGGVGVLVDIETLSPSDDENYLKFLLAMQKELHDRQMKLVVSVPSGSQAYDVELISKIADAVVVIMHGEHYSSSKPGPLASQGWFQETLDHFSSIVPNGKLIVGLGSYGMDWPLASTTTASGLTYGEVMSKAAELGAHAELAPKSRNMVFGYTDSKGVDHDVWFLDAVAVWNQWQLVKQKNSLGVALWRLGAEDPNIWSFVGKDSPSTTGLGSVPSLYSVYSSSRSEIFRVASPPTEGELTFGQDKDGLITRAKYDKIPTGYILNRVGNAPPDKTLVLTFNGGPDPNWTPKISDLLVKHGVPGTFFVLGSQAQKYPDVLQRLAGQGFAIGNSSYQPADLRSIPTDQLKSDVNSTQRLIEDATNRHSLLFEASMPNTPEDVVPLMAVADMGYVIISPNIKTNETGSPEQLVSQIESQLGGPESHIISLPNGGGDPSVVLAALDKLIPDLKSKGYNFIRVDQSMGVSEKDLLPSYSGNEAAFVFATNIVNRIRNLFWPAITVIFFLTTGFSILRIIFMSVFVLRSTKRRRLKFRAPGSKYVSVLVPAFNEEKTIGKTLESLQGSTHQRMEILVIDDGSTDRTSEVVRQYAALDSRIRLISKPNGGKATALNIGMREAKNDLVVTIDADTILMPKTINELIKPFGDPDVDAVCGNIEVGNVHNILTGFQALEYITAQNFDRRAFEELNAISVVPGATGAWRRHKVLAIGGYESDTLTEDADLTIKLLIKGGKIVYAPEARSLTEAPDNMRDLAKQRFRWSFGTFQCLGKHSDSFFKKSVGWIALPNIFVFQILFPLLAPIGDFVFILAIINGDMMNIVYSYLFFTLLDIIGSIFAFVLEHKPKRLMLFALVQRFFYRQFLYVTIIRAIIAMLRGRRYGWNKLQRTGTVATTLPVIEKTGT
jgi:cellulose synthase/poly-beta-1,6-N-acetylglucosamine synthase-like glycosyltransferase/spore germination protein YaaH/peptidoglycan/xylan/chitin deacetylase (PgdA/CDA1 family)